MRAAHIHDHRSAVENHGDHVRRARKTAQLSRRHGSAVHQDAARGGPVQKLRVWDNHHELRRTGGDSDLAPASARTGTGGGLDRFGSVDDRDERVGEALLWVSESAARLRVSFAAR